LYGYQPSVILLDEPDAHLHVNLQRQVLDYFKLKSKERGIQFLIATHAEELVKGVDTTQIVSLLRGTPARIATTPPLLRAMADVPNDEIVRLRSLSSPFILFVEGESDERMLRAWASQCGASESINKLCFRVMGGGSKRDMKERADTHFAALKELIPSIKKMMLFDYDDGANAFHPGPNNSGLVEWKRRNVENYLLVPDAWERAILNYYQFSEPNLMTKPSIDIVKRFFVGENLTLPPGSSWRDVGANIFQTVNGKRILFENVNSLFQQLRNESQELVLKREDIALNMTADEIHNDIHDFMKEISRIADETISTASAAAIGLS
jgi:AAA domain, putative AbiEii toxin, Type IV TA system